MFEIIANRGIWLPALTLRLGANVYPSRQSIPPDLWPRLDRFRSLGLLDFEGPAAAGDDAPKLAELSQAQLYGLSKAELANLARLSGVSMPEGASKVQLIEALCAAQKGAA